MRRGVGWQILRGVMHLTDDPLMRKPQWSWRCPCRVAEAIVTYRREERV